jgi:hypothetical protein
MSYFEMVFLGGLASLVLVILFVLFIALAVERKKEKLMAEKAHRECEAKEAETRRQRLEQEAREKKRLEEAKVTDEVLTVLKSEHRVSRPRRTEVILAPTGPVYTSSPPHSGEFPFGGPITLSRDPRFVMVPIGTREYDDPSGDIRYCEVTFKEYPDETFSFSEKSYKVGDEVRMRFYRDRETGKVFKNEVLSAE